MNPDGFAWLRSFVAWLLDVRRLDPQEEGQAFPRRTDRVKQRTDSLLGRFERVNR